MKTSFARFLLLTAALLVLSGANAMAQDGKALYASKGCTACHGPDGKAPIMPMYPKLAGQNSEYMFEQIKDFKANKRTNGQAALMVGMVAALSEAEAKAISDYLSKVK